MASALRQIAAAPDPLFEVQDQSTRPNGLRVERLRVPLGVIGVVYENRPNVTCDVAGLCVRSGNAAFLRGSSTRPAHELVPGGPLARGAREGGAPHRRRLAGGGPLARERRGRSCR